MKGGLIKEQQQVGKTAINRNNQLLQVKELVR
jgi:hypothetical protein